MIHEACVTLLESGFLPKTNNILRRKLRDVLLKACDKLSEKLHVTIVRSTSMICIADDLGILEENEVSIRFSHPFFDEEKGIRKYYLDEDVLVARVFRFSNVQVDFLEPGLAPLRYPESARRKCSKIESFNRRHRVFGERAAKQGFAPIWRGL